MYDMKASKYFQSLSIPIQEKVWDCGLLFESDEELRGYVAKLAYL